MSELTQIDPEETVRLHWRRPSLPSGISFEDSPSRTKQGDRDAVDINAIVAKYHKTGVLPGMRDIPEYGDDTASTTLHESLNIVRDAEAAFATLPSVVRDACGNDPGQLLDLVADPARRDEAIELGLIDKPVGDPQKAVPGGETPTTPSAEIPPAG